MTEAVKTIQIHAVPPGQRITLGAPSLAALPNGKLLAAFDQSGPDVKGLSGKKGHDAKRNRWMQGLVYRSADGGETWQRVASYPFRRASLFRDGGDLYLLGEASGGLCLMRSPDGGASWSAPMDLTGDVSAETAPTAVAACGGHWVMPVLAPAGGERGLQIWHAPRGASLMNRKAWAAGPVSPPLAALLPKESGACGVPWPGTAPAWRNPLILADAPPGFPWTEAGGWPLLASAVSGREHWAVWLAVSADDFSVRPVEAGPGRPWLWIPLPGGHARFDLFRDEPSGLYWLAGAMGAPGLAAGRGAGRLEQSRALGAWVSENLVDWQWAGSLLAGGEGPEGVRCDPAAAVTGGDWVVACRAGGEGSRRARETTRILCIRRGDFRTRRAGFSS